MKFTNGPKVIKCTKADIHLHYANNKGRGTNNVTVTVVLPGADRLPRTGSYGVCYVDRWRQAGWRGIVNIPDADIARFGGLA